MELLLSVYHVSYSCECFESVRFLFDFTRKSKTAREIGTPFDDVCHNFLLFYRPKTNNSFNSKNFSLNFLTTKERTSNTSIIKHKLGKRPRVCERQMARIELCRLPFSF